MSWASNSTQGRSPSFLTWSFEHQFNSSSRTLRETIGKWILLMWGAGTLPGAVITDKTTKMKIHIPMWSTVAQLWQQQNGSMCHFFWNQRLWLVYTLLVTRLHSSTFVYIRRDSSTFVYTRLHLSSDSSVFLENIIYFLLFYSLYPVEITFIQLPNKIQQLLKAANVKCK